MNDIPVATGRIAPTSTARGRAGWLLADQAVSSLSNVAVAVVIARAASLKEFGAYAVAAIVYLLSVELVRPLALDPLLVRFSGGERNAGTRAFRGAAGVALALGLVIGAGSVAVGSALNGPVAPMLLVVGAAMPALLLQDACRYSLMASGRARSTAINDILWLILQTAAFAALLIVNIESSAWFLAAWGAGAAVAAAVGVVQIGALPSLRTAPGWLIDNRDIAPFYVVEYLVDAGALQATLLAVGLVGGLEALGALNGARVLLGPLSIVFLSAMSIVVTESSRLRQAADSRAIWLVRGSGVALVMTTLVWTLVLTFLPQSVGTAVLGESFTEAREVLLGLGLYWAARGSIIASRAGFRVAQLARRSVATMAALAPLTVIGGIAGALLGGAVGASFGLAAGNVVGAAVWATRFERIRDACASGPRADLDLVS